MLYVKNIFTLIKVKNIPEFYKTPSYYSQNVLSDKKNERRLIIFH